MPNHSYFPLCNGILPNYSMNNCGRRTSLTGYARDCCSRSRIRIRVIRMSSSEIERLLRLSDAGIRSKLLQPAGQVQRDLPCPWHASCIRSSNRVGRATVARQEGVQDSKYSVQHHDLIWIFMVQVSSCTRGGSLLPRSPLRAPLADVGSYG
jgi:hypothetical protein